MPKHYEGTWLDHSLLSPCGSVSKRSRKAAMRRLEAALAAHKAQQPDSVILPPDPKQDAAMLRQRAADLRHYAAMGMRRKRYEAQAEQLELEALRLEGLA